LLNSKGIMMKIKTLIVEDEPEWLELYLQELSLLDYIEIFNTVTTVEKAVELSKIMQPDIILMDLNLSKDNFEGITAISEILQDIDTKIIVVTSHFDKTLIDEAFYAGAVEYLLKHNLKRLPEVIKEVYENVSPHAVLANTYSRHRKESQFNTLSKAEKEILQLKKQGFTHNEIEKMAYKAQSTLKHQIGSLLKKLNVPSCQEAIKKFKQFIE
jgi:two-component system, NarL family, response regulator DevR